MSGIRLENGNYTLTWKIEDVGKSWTSQVYKVAVKQNAMGWYTLQLVNPDTNATDYTYLWDNDKKFYEDTSSMYEGDTQYPHLKITMDDPGSYTVTDDELYTGELRRDEDPMMDSTEEPLVGEEGEVEETMTEEEEPMTEGHHMTEASGEDTCKGQEEQISDHGEGVYAITAHHYIQHALKHLNSSKLDENCKVMLHERLFPSDPSEDIFGSRVKARKKPANKKPANKKSANKKPSDKKPADKKPATKKPATKKPATKKPATKKPADKKPANKKPATKKPVTKKPANKKPADKKPADKKPADKNQGKNRPSTLFRNIMLSKK